MPSFLETSLPNGLEVIAEVDAEAHSSAFGFFVKTGARDESSDVAGVSHFLEHMVFKGTPTRSAEDVNREFDEMGAHHNAFTGHEATVYYAAVLPEYQDSAVRLLGDILRPSLREEDFETEKQVIIEEIRMYEDQPPFGADDKCRELHFAGHPLGNSILGTVESITALKVDAMRAYFNERYSPRNISLVATGRIDFDELVRSAESVCSQWEAFEAHRAASPAPANHGFHVIHKESATQQYSIQLSNAPSATDPDRFAAHVLSTVIGDDSGSRLYWQLVDTGLAEHAVLGHYDYQGTGLYMTMMSCQPENAADNLQRILDTLRQAERESVTAAELAQAKSKINSRMVLSSEKPRGRLFNVGSNWIQRREYRHVRDDLDAIESVTLEDVAAVLARYPLSKTTTVVVGPLKDVKAPE